MDKANFIKTIQFHIDFTLKAFPESSLPNSHKIEENMYYVNGIMTDKKTGDDNAYIIERYFGLDSAPILIHNTTNGILKDIGEASKDYIWGSKFVAAKKNHNSLPNDVSIHVLTMLQAAKNKDIPIGIVGGSQGSLITTNCLLAFSYLNKDNVAYLKQKVRVCHFGTVVPVPITNYLSSLLNKYTTAVNPKDPVASYLGFKKIPGPLFAINLVKNNFFKYHFAKWYLPVDTHVIDYYAEKGKYDKNEPFIKKDFFITPYIDSDPINVNQSTNKWLEPFLNITMQS